MTGGGEGGLERRQVAFLREGVDQVGGAGQRLRLVRVQRGVVQFGEKILWQCHDD